MNTKISVIIPVYNVEMYLQQCFDKLLNQSLRELEIICINDGSTDRSLSLVQEYAGKDSRIKVYDKSNEGAGPTRNFGLQIAIGEYVFFCDPDDYLSLDALEKLYVSARENDSDAVFLNWYVNEKPQRYVEKIPDVVNAPSSEQRNLLLSAGCGASWGKLYRRNFLLENGVLFSKAMRGEDYIVHWKSCLLGNRYTVIKEPLYHYRFPLFRRITTKFQRYGTSALDAQMELFDWLNEHNYYRQHQFFYSMVKIVDTKMLYDRSPKKTQEEYTQRIIETFSDDDWRLIENFELYSCHLKIPEITYCTFGIFPLARYVVLPRVFFVAGRNTYRRERIYQTSHSTGYS